MNTQTTGMTYADAGVDYDPLDLFKVECQQKAKETAVNLKQHNLEEIEASRGESAYLMQTVNGEIIAHVEEGLGTKNLVADIMYGKVGRSYYDQLAQDTVAMIVNDMITLGVPPVSVAMHLAVEDGSWLKDERRRKDLVDGWAAACMKAGCVWAGGETPALKHIIKPAASLLSGSAIGFTMDDSLVFHSEDIKDGDRIVVLESSGIHANGLTLARKIAEVMPQGYLTRSQAGRYYGDVLLDPTPIYVPFVRKCQDAGIPIRYAINITGHGWRKLMRAKEPFNYIITTMPSEKEIFQMIQKWGGVDEREMYANYNMGAGFAVILGGGVGDAIDIAKEDGFVAFDAGFVVKSTEKRVVIEPKDIIFNAETLAVR